MKKYLHLFSILLLFCTMLSIWFFPSSTLVLGIASLLFSLAISIHAIFEKHKGTENPRPKITKDTLVLILTILVIAFLGGIVAMLSIFYVSLSFGAVAGLVSAAVISCVIGYAVKKGMEGLI